MAERLIVAEGQAVSCKLEGRQGIIVAAGEEIPENAIVDRDRLIRLGLVEAVGTKAKAAPAPSTPKPQTPEPPAVPDVPVETPSDPDTPASELPIEELRDLAGAVLEITALGPDATEEQVAEALAALTVKQLRALAAEFQIDLPAGNAKAPIVTKLLAGRTPTA